MFLHLQVVNNCEIFKMFLFSGITFNNLLNKQLPLLAVSTHCILCGCYIIFKKLSNLWSEIHCTTVICSVHCMTVVDLTFALRCLQLCKLCALILQAGRPTTFALSSVRRRRRPAARFARTQTTRASRPVRFLPGQIARIRLRRWGGATYRGGDQMPPVDPPEAMRCTEWVTRQLCGRLFKGQIMDLVLERFCRKLLRHQSECTRSVPKYANFSAKLLSLSAVAFLVHLLTLFLWLGVVCSWQTCKTF